MNVIAGLAAALVTAVALPRVAAAQPSATEPVVVAAPAPERNWGIGLHLGGMGVHPEGDDREEAHTGLGGGGVQLRYRLAPRWELDLDVSGYAEDRRDDDGDGLRRTMGMVVLGAMFHINPRSDWKWSVLAGIGGAHDTLEVETKAGERQRVAEFSNGLFRLGVGLEKRWERFGLAAQIYGLAMERDDDELDGPAYMDQDTPIARKQSGALFQIAGNYYF
jgi:hypothetical protein